MVIILDWGRFILRFLIQRAITAFDMMIWFNKPGDLPSISNLNTYPENMELNLLVRKTMVQADWRTHLNWIEVFGCEKIYMHVPWKQTTNSQIRCFFRFIRNKSNTKHHIVYCEWHCNNSGITFDRKKVVSRYAFAFVCGFSSALQTIGISSSLKSVD